MSTPMLKAGRYQMTWLTRQDEATVRKMQRRARIAAKRAKNHPQPNTPKCERERVIATPSPALTTEGIRLLGHAPRPRTGR